MSEHSAGVRWSRAIHAAIPSTFSRNHQVSLNGGQTVNVSSSVEFKGDANCADPEQLLVGAVASCHMLTFLALADMQGYRVESYVDNATAYLEKPAGMVPRVSRIVLAPEIRFGGDKVPDASALERLHASAHKNCFIAQSVSAKVSVSQGARGESAS